MAKAEPVSADVPLGYVAEAAIARGFEDPDAKVALFKTSIGLFSHHHTAVPVPVYLTPQPAPDAEAGNWQQYALRGSGETAEQVIVRERKAYADLLASVLAERALERARQDKALALHDAWFTRYVQSLGGMTYNSLSLHTRAAWLAAVTAPGREAGDDQFTEEARAPLAHVDENPAPAASHKDSNA